MPDTYDYKTGSRTETWRETEEKSRILKKNIEAGQCKGFAPNIENIYGICFSCSWFDYSINDIHQVCFAACGRREMLLTGRHKIKHCNSHKPKGQMDLQTMFGLATLIDGENVKDKPGFLEMGRDYEKNK